jgi:16S rRNA (guanine527-N7)-methyltransferase
MTSVVADNGSLVVSRETERRLQVYSDMLERWGTRINLVSRATLPDLYTRHIVDSAQLFDHAPPDSRTWVDLGAGAGLPALIIAAIAADAAPYLSVTAIESDSRKCAFMADAARAMGVTLDLRPTRIEAVPAFSADVVSARALAPLAALFPLVAPFLGGVGLFPKGARHRTEIEAVARDWRFDHRLWPSKTEPSAAIVEIRRLRRVTT